MNNNVETLTPDERAQTYLKALNTGMTYRQVGEMYDSSADAVRNVVRRYNARMTGSYAGYTEISPAKLKNINSVDVDSAETAEEVLATVPKYSPKIVTIDIERMPNVGFFWHPRTRDGWISETMVMEPSRMISFAAKVLNGPVFFSSEYHHGREQMLKSLWTVMDEADILITYNGKRFDVPHIAGELRDNGFKSYRPFKQIDLLQSVKQKFGYDYKTLASVASRWGLSEKMDTGGFDLWRKCYNGDAEAWDTMRKYNMQDVRVTEAVYLSNLSWLSGSIPNLGLWVFSEDGFICPACSSTKVVESGTATTGVTRYVAYVCKDCGYRSRSNEKVNSTTLRPVTW